MSAAATEPIPRAPNAIAPATIGVNRSTMFVIVLPFQARDTITSAFDATEAAKIERPKGGFWQFRQQAFRFAHDRDTRKQKCHRSAPTILRAPLDSAQRRGQGVPF